MTTWFNLMAIAGGGALGSVCRYGLSVGASLLPGGSTMLGTTAANLIGCAAIGAFMSYLDIRSVGPEIFPERARLAIQVGFFGGLTTFSTYTAEKAMLIQSGRLGMGGLYIAANLLLGLLVLVLAAEGVKTWMSP